MQLSPKLPHRSIVATRLSRDVYAPGDNAPRSGIYRVRHDGHRADHAVVILESEVFPACRTCKGRVRFHLISDAPHIAQEWDFAAPLDLTLRRSRGQTG